MEQGERQQNYLHGRVALLLDSTMRLARGKNARAG
jgi:hypothetical protein